MEGKFKQGPNAMASLTNKKPNSAEWVVSLGWGFLTGKKQKKKKQGSSIGNHSQIQCYDLNLLNIQLNQWTEVTKRCMEMIYGCSMGRLKGSFLFCLFFHRLKGSILYLIGKINGHQRVQLGIIILICI